MSYENNARQLEQLLPQLRHPAVADLAWSVFAIPLITSLPEYPQILIPCFPLNEQRIRWLHSLQEAPNALLKHLQQPKTKRLGQYFEALWEFFLSQDPETELLAKNLQVQHRGRTLGEFDFLYRDTGSNQLIHLELAIKLYLGFAMTPSTNPSPLDWWQGPNCIDRLDLKIDKLFNKQLRLSRSDVAQQSLLRLGFGTPRPALFLGGYLFYPSHATLNAPAIIDPSHQQGEWMFLKDLQRRLPGEQRYITLEISAWLCRHTHVNKPPLYRVSELQEILQTALSQWGRPVLVCAVAPSPDGWREQQRFFVAPDNWPVVMFQHRK